MTEREFENLVLKFLSAHPRVKRVWRSDSNFSRSRMTKDPFRIGVPDVQGFTKSGKFFCLELKVEGGKKRPAQIQFLEDAVYCGVHAAFCKTFEEVEFFAEHL